MARSFRNEEDCPREEGLSRATHLEETPVGFGRKAPLHGGDVANGETQILVGTRGGLPRQGEQRAFLWALRSAENPGEFGVGVVAVDTRVFHAVGGPANLD